jgi:hypothetical protein
MAGNGTVSNNGGFLSSYDDPKRKIKLCEKRTKSTLIDAKKKFSLRARNLKLRAGKL